MAIEDTPLWSAKYHGLLWQLVVTDITRHARSIQNPAMTNLTGRRTRKNLTVGNTEAKLSCSRHLFDLF